MVSARVSNGSYGFEPMDIEQEGLDGLTEVFSDMRFSSHLKKVARDIYDHLSEHLGGWVHNSLN